VREAIFSILGPLDGLRVLDLFAGSGALGIEALSRGAAAAIFVDEDPRAIAAVRANLAAIGKEAGVYRRDALAFLAAPVAAANRFDVAFVDPPYSSARRLARPLSERLPTVLSATGRIVSESDKRAPLELTIQPVDIRVYGDTQIAIHHAG